MTATIEQVMLDTAPPDVIIRPMLTVDSAIDDYLGDLLRRRYSKRTIDTYGRILNELADRLPDHLDVSKITEDDVRRYLGAKACNRKTGRANTVGTIAHAESVISSWLRWLFQERKIGRNPTDRLSRTRRIPAEDLDVITVSTADVPRLLVAAAPGTELNTVALAGYVGARRAALARLRLTDYDREQGTLRFREKGAKTIEKPVPGELAAILNASIVRGDIRPAPHDYLIPPEGYLTRAGDRDDRVVWRVVRRVAARAGIDAHVHALRAAFACFYLERNPDDLLGLKELLGHRSLNTTLIYLRRLNKRAAMERVRSLSWAATDPGNGAAWLSQSPPTSLVAGLGVGAGGFEPPSSESRAAMRSGSEHLDASLLREAASKRDTPVAARPGGDS